MQGYIPYSNLSHLSTCLQVCYWMRACTIPRHWVGSHVHSRVCTTSQSLTGSMTTTSCRCESTKKMIFFYTPLALMTVIPTHGILSVPVVWCPVPRENTSMSKEMVMGQCMEIAQYRTPHSQYTCSMAKVSNSYWESHKVYGFVRNCYLIDLLLLLY